MAAPAPEQQQPEQQPVQFQPELEPVIETTPEIVRMRLLRAIEICAKDTVLSAMDEAGAADLGSAALRFAQAYLLLDPLVDSEGIPVAGKAIVDAMASTGQSHAEPQQPEPAGEDGQAHGNVKKKPGQPPKVLPGDAAQHLAEMHPHMEDALKGARGSRPLPKPRPSA